ncbi:cytochrome-c peroxidase [Ruegeria hyattellae]|uniref:cytochrome-c peroxidase n=1 Tax=Ruegeria hyattellae TaxID=3233337 RepID=UPI00355C3BC9
MNTWAIKYTLLVTAIAFVSLGSAQARDLPQPLNDSDFLYNGTPNAEVFELGRMLFFDPILSGNLNISCGTCHSPGHGTGDNISLSIGEGGQGFAMSRKTGPMGVVGRVPRNAQPLYNVGARSYTSFFHDGRLEPDPMEIFQSGFWSPAREHLPEGLDNLLAAQAMFPVLSPIEMAGQKGENPVATAVAEDRLVDAWSHLAKRLADVPEYRAMFEAAFGPGDVTFVQAANALAAFQSKAFRSEGNRFLQALRDNDPSLLSDAARDGMNLFFGEAGCSGCHSGPLMTDHNFHAIAMPQVGPGKGHGNDTGYWRASGFMDRVEDEGRFRVTFDPEDRFAFRTPSLINVSLTGPWGHSGAYDTLEAVVRHHLNPIVSLEAYDPVSLPQLDDVIEQTGEGSQLIFRPLNPARSGAYVLRDQWVQSSDKLRSRIASENDLVPKTLSDDEVDAVLAFLRSASDPAVLDLVDLIPTSVPSGLPPQPTQ